MVAGSVHLELDLLLLLRLLRGDQRREGITAACRDLRQVRRSLLHCRALCLRTYEGIGLLVLVLLLLLLLWSRGPPLLLALSKAAPRSVVRALRRPWRHSLCLLRRLPPVCRVRTPRGRRHCSGTRLGSLRLLRTIRLRAVRGRERLPKRRVLHRSATDLCHLLLFVAMVTLLGCARTTARWSWRTRVAVSRVERHMSCSLTSATTLSWLSHSVGLT